MEALAEPSTSKTSGILPLLPGLTKGYSKQKRKRTGDILRPGHLPVLILIPFYKIVLIKNKI